MTVGKRQLNLKLNVLAACIFMMGVDSLAVMQLNARMPHRVNGAFGLEEVISGELRSAGFSGTWVSGTEYIYTNLQMGTVMKYNVVTGGETQILDRAFLEEYAVTSYELSADGLFVLIGYDLQSGFRHSTRSRFFMYDLSTGYPTYIHGGELLQLVRLSPVGNALVYVYDNNIYFRNSGKSSAIEEQVTSDGVPGVVYNGVPDWVYEEEVFGSATALWFSPDGNSLAFAQFDDRDVNTESYFLYGEPGTLQHQYSETVSIRYPKPGTNNPVVWLKVVDLTDISKGYIMIPAPTNVVTNQHILHTVTWANNVEVAAIWSNRVQNVAQLNICVAKTGACTATYQMSETGGWLDIAAPVFDNTGTRLVTVLPQPQDGGDGNYSQVTRLTRQSSLRATMTTEQPLSYGRSVVTYVYGWDTVNNIIYYLSTPEDGPSQQHVYAVAADGSRAPECLSCYVTTIEGNKCLYASASFSSDFSHWALTCSGPDPPHVDLYRYGQSSPVMMLEDNAVLRGKLNGRSLPMIVDTEVEVEEGFRAKARLWLPPGMDQSGRNKYPMLVYVYGGPNSVQIRDAFTLGWGAYLTTSRNIIYALIDGRGSGLKGDSMKFSIYRRLGTVEIYDQIAVAKALQTKYQYIDSSRTAIWGWSYGGYATAMALARDTEGVFKCGVSVAPVSSWIYYDSIYTERYMGLPTMTDNEVGYNNSDVTRLVEGFRGKQFYLLHGNADDNVHYLQAMALSKALEYSNILFSQQSYPDENHSLSHVLLHVYRSMDKFWTQCFDLDNNYRHRSYWRRY